MDIQAGKTYRSRSGEVFGPIEPNSNYLGREDWTNHFWLCPRTGRAWGKTGLYMPLSRVADPLDLIEEVE